MQILRATTRRASPTCRLDRPDFLPTRLLRAYAEQPPLVFSHPAPPLIFAACMAPPSAPVEAQFFPRDTSDFTDLSPRQTRILRARTRGGVGFGYATQRDCYALTLTTGRGFYSRQPLYFEHTWVVKATTLRCTVNFISKHLWVVQRTLFPSTFGYGDRSGSRRAPARDEFAQGVKRPRKPWLQRSDQRRQVAAFCT